MVVKREDCVRALRAVHSRFYLSRTTIAMGIVGPGLIGGTLLDQLRDQVHYVFFISHVIQIRSMMCFGTWNYLSLDCTCFDASLSD